MTADYSNPQVDALIDQASSINDPATRSYYFTKPK